MLNSPSWFYWLLNMLSIAPYASWSSGTRHRNKYQWGNRKWRPKKECKTSQLQPEFKIKVKNGLFTPTCFHCEPPELITYQTTLFCTQNQKWIAKGIAHPRWRLTQTFRGFPNPFIMHQVYPMADCCLKYHQQILDSLSERGNHPIMRQLLQPAVTFSLCHQPMGR